MNPMELKRIHQKEIWPLVVSGVLPMKSYINTAIAEVAEGIDTKRNNLICHGPEM